MPSSVRAGAVLLIAVAALSVALLALTSSLLRHTLAFTLGVEASAEVLSLKEGSSACQGPIEVLVPFDAIRFRAGSNAGAGSPLEVTVRGRDGRRLASARVPAGYTDERPVVTRVGRVAAGGPVSVCFQAFTNTSPQESGDTSVELWGNLGRTLPTSDLRLGEELRGEDLSLAFLRDRPVSAASLVPAMLERAALFGPGLLGPAALAVLLLLAVLGAPPLLALALVRAGGRSPSEEARAASVPGE